MGKRMTQFLSIIVLLLLWVEASQAAALTAIIKRGYLRVAVKDNLRPLGFRDDKGQLQGLEIDMARRLAQELLGNDDAVALKPVANRARLTAVRSGTVDLAIANITTTANRLRIVNLSQPYLRSSIGILTQTPQIRRLQDLGGQPVAVLNGSRTIAILQTAFPSINLVGVDSYTTAKMLLDRSEVAAFGGDSVVLTGWVQQAPTYRLLPTTLSSQALAIALPKGRQYEPLRVRINQALSQWQREGWLRSRIQAWGLSEPPPPTDNS